MRKREPGPPKYGQTGIAPQDVLPAKRDLKLHRGWVGGDTFIIKQIELQFVRGAGLGAQSLIDYSDGTTEKTCSKLPVQSLWVRFPAACGVKWRGERLYS